jgi:hypothetical protein
MDMIPQNIESVQILDWTVNVNTKIILTWTLNNIFTSTKMNIFEVHAKFAIKWQLLIKVNTSTWTPNNKNMTTSHFDIFLHILIIYNLYGSCLYPYISMLVGVFILILIVDEWVGWSWCREKIIHQLEMGCLGS